MPFSKYFEKKKTFLLLPMENKNKEVLKHTIALVFLSFLLEIWSWKIYLDIPNIAATVFRILHTKDSWHGNSWRTCYKSGGERECVCSLCHQQDVWIGAPGCILTCESQNLLPRGQLITWYQTHSTSKERQVHITVYDTNAIKLHLNKWNRKEASLKQHGLF